MAPSTRGIIIVALVFSATAICTGTGQYAFGYFIEPLAMDYGWNRTAISASLSFAAVTGLAAPLLGRAMDRYGTRPILVGSLLVAGSSLLVRPFMTELWHLYVLSLIQFTGYAGATVLPMGKLVAVWYPRTRGRVMAVAVMGNNFGGLTVPGLVALVLAYATWREGFMAVGLVCWIIAGLSWWLVREAPESGGTGCTAAGSAPSNSGYTLGEAMRMPAFYVVLCVIALGTFTYSTILPHIPAHLMNLGMSLAAATITLKTVALGGIFGKVIFGFMAERIGPRFATAVNLLGQALLGSALGLTTSHAQLQVVAPLFGVFMGGFGVVHTLLVQDVFGLKYYGSIMGTLNASTVLSFGLGPIFAGLVFDLTGAYAWAFCGAGLLFAVAALNLLVFNPGQIRHGSLGA
ncbi:MAG: MFS transporter [Gammaproteobacteria bacterium]|nr:MFS transporter [Gammaproteobacteria bacterium]